MSEDPNVEVGRGMGGGSMGRNTQRLSEAKASLKIDTQKLDQLKRGLEGVHGVVKSLREEMEKLAAASQNVSLPGGAGGASFLRNFPTSLQGGGQANTSRPGATDVEPMSAGINAAFVTSLAGRFPKISGMVGKFTSSGLFEKMTAPGALGAVNHPGVQLAASAGETIGGGINSAFKAVAQATNARYERGIAYATSADKLNVLMQQMYGMSQVQVMRNMRMPVTDYRIGGPGAVNDMMAFQTQTGFEASAQLASSVAGIRAAGGYSRSTGQVLAQQQQLMDPRVANRMFYMTGTAAFNIGGGMRDPMQMRQELIRNLGLSNENVLEGAFAPGSVTRARMADIGIGEEMQTELLQMAQQQVSFQKRGGRGAYDPSKKAHREMMGIESNLATQQEETARVETHREEKFMERQIDNMATREKIDRQLIRVLGALEDTLSGLIGKDISHGKLLRGPMGKAAGFAGGLLKAATPVAAILGFAAGGPLGAAAAAGATSLAGAALAGAGDGAAPRGSSAGGGASTPASTNFRDASNDSQIMVPGGARGSKRVPLSQLKQRPDVQKMDSNLREKIFAMMRANPNVGITSGYRSYDEQLELFHTNMVAVSDEEAANLDPALVTEFEGQKYAPDGDKAFVAAPGRSMHNLGYAADIFEEGDNRSYAWIVSNSARFGLNNWRAKGWRDDEPWHVQSDDVPRTYNEAIAAGLRATVGETPTDPLPVDAEGDNGMGEGGGGVSASGLERVDNRGLSTQDIIQAQSMRNAGKIGSAGGGATFSTFAKPSSVSSGGGGSYSPGEALAGESVARFASAAGFSGEALERAVAIAYRESRFNPSAHRTDTDKSKLSGDRGLWQINHSAWDAILAEQGIISSNTPEGRAELFDPATNARAAYFIYNRSGNFSAWGMGPDGWEEGGDPMHGTNLGAAKEVVKNAFEFMTPDSTGGGVGDATARSMRLPSKTPRASSPGGGGQSSYTVNNSPNITVAPVINFNGAPATPDLRNIAQTVSRMIKEEVEMLELRNA